MPLRRGMSSIEQIEKERLGGARLGQQKWSPSLASVRRSELHTQRRRTKRKGREPTEQLHCHLQVSIHAPAEAISKEAVMPGLRPLCTPTVPRQLPMLVLLKAERRFLPSASLGIGSLDADHNGHCSGANGPGTIGGTGRGMAAISSHLGMQTLID